MKTDHIYPKTCN